MSYTRFYTIAALIVLSLVLLAQGAWADDWPQWRGLNRDGVWNEKGLIEKFPDPQIKRVWSAPVSNGYSGPTVAKGRVYITDRIEEPVELERVLCFDAATGKKIWEDKYECEYRDFGYEDGPRASVSISDGMVYTLGSMGHIRCLDAESGKLIWKKDPGTDYEVEKPIWGISASPLVDGDNVIYHIGARPDACIVALDKKTGEEKWRALEDDVSYSAPVITEQADQRVLICWTGNNLAGLNPATGEVHWKYPTPAVEMIINVATPVIDDNRVFLSSFYDGSYMLKLSEDKLAVEKIWRRLGKDVRNTDGLQGIIATTIVKGDYIYGPDSHGEFRCLKADTGDRVWQDLTVTPKVRWGTVHMVQNGEITWMFNERGELIISKLSPKGFEEISRAKLLEPTMGQLDRKGGVCWSHPAFANKHVFARNDKELVCANLAAE